MSAPLPRLCFAALRIAMKDSYRNVASSAGELGSEARARAQEELAEHIDWEGTARLRRRVDAVGMGVAEAMDTAQRFEIGWPVARELIERCGRLRLENGFVAGAGVDSADPSDFSGRSGRTRLMDQVVAQVDFIQSCGGAAILLPVQWLVEQKCGEREYVEFYGDVIDAVDGPLLVHWLGEMFNPRLAGYFPGESFRRVMALDPAKVLGAKLSLLDDDVEIELRRELGPRGQIVLTGDDLHFADLIAGEVDAELWGTVGWAGREFAVGDFSHALLGAFDAVAAPVAEALRGLADDRTRYRELLDGAQALSRHVFGKPTSLYKAGLAFHAWLSGWQDNFLLPFHIERQRGVEHYQELARLALDVARSAEELATVRRRTEQFRRGRWELEADRDPTSVS